VVKAGGLDPCVRRVVLLPGMDGTGVLFRDFTALAPPGVLPEVVALPSEPLSYAGLADILSRRLELSPGCVLLAESFSGPLAVTLAARHPVAALVLCNSFVRPPRPSALRALAVPALFRGRVPRWVVRRYFVGPDASPGLVDRVRDTVAAVPPSLLAGRLSSILGTDVSGTLARVATPVLYLRGMDDRLVPERSVAEVAGAVQARVVRIPGPHLLLQTRPEAAWAAIGPFLAGITAAPHPARAESRPETV
jgi:pimeloyl-ACP methyl ester carboxylesterase